MARDLAVIKREMVYGASTSRKFGIQDRTYGAYLQRLNPRENIELQTA